MKPKPITIDNMKSRITAADHARAERLFAAVKKGDIETIAAALAEHREETLSCAGVRVTRLLRAFAEPVSRIVTAIDQLQNGTTS